MSLPSPKTVKPDNVPRHVAVIMDGNGRWAKQRNKPRHSGHRAGVKSVRMTVEAAAEQGVEYLTLFAFSTENWLRPAEEVGALMKLFGEALRREVGELHRNNVQLKFVGAIGELGSGLREKIAKAEARTAANTGLRLTVAIAYGGRWDVIQATRSIAAKVAGGEMGIDAIDDEAFAAELSMSDLPDPDLLIRTGGEQRVSNFLLWNLAYAELWFTDVLWPEFSKDIFEQAIAEFGHKQRRFGHTGEQVEGL